MTEATEQRSGNNLVIDTLTCDWVPMFVQNATLFLADALTSARVKYTLLGAGCEGLFALTGAGGVAYPFFFKSASNLI